MSRRRSRARTARRVSVPALNRYGSKQAYHALLSRATRRRIIFTGRCTGVFQKGDKLYLYEDRGVGCVRPKIVTAIPPLNAWKYLPQYRAA